MLRETFDRIFQFCFAAIGGSENEDVKYILEGRQKQVTRDNFFGEAVWAILVSGISRKSAAAVSARMEECGFEWDFRQVVRWTPDEWAEFFGRLYPDGLKPRSKMKWKAIRTIAEILAAFPDEVTFQAEFFGGKTKGAELNKQDIYRLAARGLSFIRYTNAQYIIRNMGGDSIKCDRWVSELLRHFRVSGAELERELVSLGISLSLFDVVLWAYCEMFVKRVASFDGHFSELLSQPASG